MKKLCLLAALLAAFSGHAKPDAVGLGSAISAGPCGDLPCGSAVDTRPDGAVSFFDTGAPSSAVWGPSADKTLQSLSGAAASLWLSIDPEDFDGTDLTAGGTGAVNFSEVGTLTTHESALYNDGGEIAVLGNKAGMLISDSELVGPQTGPDFAFEILIRSYYSSSGVNSCVQYTATGGQRYEVRVSNTTLTFTYSSSSGTDSLVGSQPFAFSDESSAFIHFLVLSDGDGSDITGKARLYLNGELVDSDFRFADPNTNTSNFGYGGSRTSNRDCQGYLGSMNIWEGQLGDYTDYDEIALERFSRVSGFYVNNEAIAQIAARDDSLRVVRRCEADDDRVYMDIVGPHWPIREVLCGTDWSNPATAVENAAFTVTDATVIRSDYGLEAESLTTSALSVTANSEEGPVWGFNADALIADGTTAAHTITYTTTTAMSAGEFSASIFAKAGDMDWISLTESGSTSWFNVSSCTAGTVNHTHAMIEDFGNSWCRVGIHVASHAAAVGDTVVAVGSANNFTTSTGDGVTTSVTVMGMQIEESRWMTSWWPFFGDFDVTTAQDYTNWAAARDDGPLTVIVNETSFDRGYLAELQDDITGTAPDYRALAWRSATDDRSAFFGTYNGTTRWSSAYDPGDTLDTYHTMRVILDVDYGVSCSDGTCDPAPDTDSAGNPGPRATHMSIGGYTAAALVPRSAHIFRIRAYNGNYEPGESGTGDDT